MLGDTNWKPDLVSGDSPGESGNAFAAFAYAMSSGGCLYDSFTPAACNKGFGAWVEASDRGLIKINPTSFHAAGEPQKYMYSIRPGDSDKTLVNSAEAIAIINDVASKVGISRGDYITPNVATYVQTPVVVPETIKNVVAVDPVVTNTTNTTSQQVQQSNGSPEAETGLGVDVANWLNETMVGGISNKWLVAGVGAAAILFMMGGSNGRR